jgi:hypothetical protein
MELRWYVRPGWDGPEKVLQYRVKVPLYRYEEKNPFWGQAPTAQLDTPLSYAWGPWKDVPEEGSE